jgi:hypothetical protein
MHFANRMFWGPCFGARGPCAPKHSTHLQIETFWVRDRMFCVRTTLIGCCAVIGPRASNHSIYFLSHSPAVVSRKGKCRPTASGVQWAVPFIMRSSASQNQVSPGTTKCCKCWFRFVSGGGGAPETETFRDRDLGPLKVSIQISNRNF